MKISLKMCNSDKNISGLSHVNLNSKYEMDKGLENTRVKRVEYLPFVRALLSHSLYVTLY